MKALSNEVFGDFLYESAASTLGRCLRSTQTPSKKGTG